MAPAADVAARRRHEHSKPHLLLDDHDGAFVRTKSSVQHLPEVDAPGLEGVIVTPALAISPVRSIAQYEIAGGAQVGR